MWLSVWNMWLDLFQGRIMKYKIIDWAYNRMFTNKTFDCMDTALDFISCQFEDDELEEIFVVDIDTRCYANGYWSTTN